MSEPVAKSQQRLRDRLENLVVDMIDQGILFTEASEQFERCFIGEVLKRKDGNHLQAAKGLGMHRNTLAKKISRYRIKPARSRPLEPPRKLPG